MEENKKDIELRIPSKLGFEKIAADCVMTIAKEMGFISSKIEDLKTAVTEACLNAIEHGNRMDQNIEVTIGISSNESAITVSVEDYGSDFFEESYREPNLSEKINGENAARGWGLFLIKQLMDKVAIIPLDHRGKRLDMTLYLQPQSGSSRAT